MPIFNLKNNLEQITSVQYYDLAGKEQVVDLSSREARALNALSLHPSAVSQVNKGILSLGQSAQKVQTEVLNSVPTFRGVGLVWGGTWVADAVYLSGWVVEYAGLTYVAQVRSVASSTTPDLDTESWKVLSILEPTAFLGVDLATVPEGGIFAKTGGIWAGKLITDANVDSISQGKIAGLVDTISLRLATTGGTMTGFVNLHANPTLALHATTKQYVDLRLPLAGGVLTGALTLAANPTAALHAATKQYVDLLAGVPLAGGTMTGALLLHAEPSQPLQASTKSYADKRLSLAGGTMTGALTLSGSPTSGSHAATKTYADAAGLAGGAMTGMLTLFGPPTAALHAATKAYVDLHVPLSGGSMTGPLHLNTDPTVSTQATRRSWVEAQLADYVPLSGASMTGPLTLSNAPTALAHAATKEYVDLLFAGGGGGLPLAGGTMAGAILGAHGLLQLDGTLPMVGAITTAPLATSATGLYHSTSYDQLAYQGRMVVQRGIVVSPSTDYTVAVGVGVVNADASSNSLVITLGDPATYPASEVIIRKLGSGSFQAVFIEATGLSPLDNDMCMRHDGEAITFFPYAAGWEIVNRAMVSDKRHEVDWITAAVVDPNNTDVSVDLLNRETRAYQINSVSDAGGGDIDITADAGWRSTPLGGLAWGGSTNKTCVVTVEDTTSYNGTHEVVSITNNNTFRITDTWVATETGNVRGVSRLVVNLPHPMQYALSDSPGGGGTPPAGTSITAVSVGQWLASGIGARSATVVNRADGRSTFRVNSTSTGLDVYVHAGILPGNDFGRIVGHSEAVSAAIKFAEAITGATDEGGGTVGLTVADSTGIIAGDTIVVTGSASYNNTYTVLSVTATQAVVTATFSGTETGTITSDNAVLVTMTRNLNLQANEGIRIQSVTFIESSEDYVGVVERIVGTTQVVVHVASVNLAGLTSGAAVATPVFRISF
jgi:hypothetical protein